MAIEINRIDFKDKIIVTTDERVFPIADLFDERGRSTDEPRCAVLCVAGSPGYWLTFTLKPYDRSALQ